MSSLSKYLVCSVTSAAHAQLDWNDCVNTSAAALQHGSGAFTVSWENVTCVCAGYAVTRNDAQ